mgnify:CR=1 FL=1
MRGMWLADLGVSGGPTGTPTRCIRRQQLGLRWSRGGGSADRGSGRRGRRWLGAAAWRGLMSGGGGSADGGREEGEWAERNEMQGG